MKRITISDRPFVVGSDSTTIRYHTDAHIFEIYSLCGDYDIFWSIDDIKKFEERFWKFAKKLSKEGYNIKENTKRKKKKLKGRNNDRV